MNNLTTLLEVKFNNWEEDRARDYITHLVYTYGANAIVDSLSEIMHKVQPSILSNFLYLFTSITKPTTDKRRQLISKGLSSNDIIIRDAIIEAIESWEDYESLDLLKLHEETVEWLKHYIQNLITELNNLNLYTKKLN